MVAKGKRQGIHWRALPEFNEWDVSSLPSRRFAGIYFSPRNKYVTHGVYFMPLTLNMLADHVEIGA